MHGWYDPSMDGMARWGDGWVGCKNTWVLNLFSCLSSFLLYFLSTLVSLSTSLSSSGCAALCVNLSHRSTEAA